MNCKDGVLRFLESARGEYVSGERLAGALGVTRQAVSKAVHVLTQEGYEISSSPRKGYLLAENCDLVSPAVIAAETGVRMLFFETVPSTNGVAAAEYLKGGECLVVARRQSAGRSKDGNGFPSPEDGGIYLSAAFPLDLAAEESDSFREGCACAVERVIEEASGKRARRVRLDEFYFGEKKTAGILTEFMIRGDTKRTEFAVVGIGIYTGAAFSREIEPVPSKESRNRMIVSLWRELQEVRKKFN